MYSLSSILGSIWLKTFPLLLDKHGDIVEAGLVAVCGGQTDFEKTVSIDPSPVLYQFLPNHDRQARLVIAEDTEERPVGVGPMRTLVARAGISAVSLGELGHATPVYMARGVMAPLHAGSYDSNFRKPLYDFLELRGWEPRAADAEIFFVPPIKKCKTCPMFLRCRGSSL